MFALMWGMNILLVGVVMYLSDKRWRVGEHKNAERLHERDLDLIAKGAGTPEEKRVLRERLQKDFNQAFGPIRTRSPFEPRRTDFRKDNRYRNVQSRNKTSPARSVLLHSVFFGFVLLAWGWTGEDTSLRLFAGEALFSMAVGGGALLGQWRNSKMTPSEDMPLLVQDFLEEERLPHLQRILRVHNEMEEGSGLFEFPVKRMDWEVVSFLMAMMVEEQRSRKYSVGRSCSQSIVRRHWAKALEKIRAFEEYTQTLSPWEGQAKDVAHTQRTSADVQKALTFEGEIDEILDRADTSPRLRVMAEETREELRRRREERVMESRLMQQAWRKEEDMATLSTARKMVGLSDWTRQESQQAEEEGTERA